MKLPIPSGILISTFVIFSYIGIPTATPAEWKSSSEAGEKAGIVKFHKNGIVISQEIGGGTGQKLSTINGGILIALSCQPPKKEGSFGVGNISITIPHASEFYKYHKESGDLVTIGFSTYGVEGSEIRARVGEPKNGLLGFSNQNITKIDRNKWGSAIFNFEKMLNILNKADREITISLTTYKKGYNIFDANSPPTNYFSLLFAMDNKMARRAAQTFTQTCGSTLFPV